MRGNKIGFSLIEVMIVVVIVGILATAVIALINPRKQIEKVWDSQRHQHLAFLQKMLEDYYNDKGAFPQATVLCYDNPVDDAGTCTCHICGVASGSTFVNGQFCDPEFSKKKYLYQYDCQTSTNWYRICAQLSTGQGYYNYGVASSNISADACNTIPLATPTVTPFTPNPTATPDPFMTPTITPTLFVCPPDSQPKFCFSGGVCNNCGTRSNCNTICDSPVQLYSTFNCVNACF